MLTLAATNTIAGVAGTGTAITYSIFGMTLLSGAETYAVLAQGQLATSVGTLYTVAASTTAFIKQIMLVNTTGSIVTGVILFANGTSAGNQITGSIMIPANGTVMIDDDGMAVYDGNGSLQSAISKSLTSLSGALLANGTVGLSADWNAGAHTITATTFSGALTGHASSDALVGQTFYIGTTQHAINQARAAEGLAGITSLTPSANFTLVQNSVNALTSVESGAIVNTLYLKAGNVGIGTTGPTHNLEVAGTARISGNTGTTLFQVAQTDSNGSYINIQPTNGSNGGTISSQWITGGGSLSFAVGNAYTKMSISDQGIVTIDNTYSLGTTQLLVQGSGAAGDATTNQLFRINQGGGTTGLMVVQGNGNVGIGTTSPTARLHIAAGVAAAHGAPLKLTPGVLLTTPELGAIEMTDDGTTAHIYMTVRISTVVTRVQVV